MNLHLPALQVVAWASMIISYSEGRSFSEAVSMTFDGEHPCPMCQAIKRQQAKATDQFDAFAPIFRIWAILPGQAHFFFAPIMISHLACPLWILGEFAHTPPHPPPRSGVS